MAVEDEAIIDDVLFLDEVLKISRCHVTLDPAGIVYRPPVGRLPSSGCIFWLCDLAVNAFHLHACVWHNIWLNSIGRGLRLFVQSASVSAKS
jgi:hypothetical protein